MRRASVLLVLVMVLPGISGAGDITAIHDIQYTTDPGGDSPLVDQMVITEGIVYGLYPSSFAIADAEGAWHGLYVYNPNLAQPAVGDAVTVTGKVQEYFGVTEVSTAASIPGTAISVDSSGNTPHAATVVATGDIATGAATAESYEGVLVEVRNVTVTDTNPDAPDNHGEWVVDDDPPERAGVRVDDKATYIYAPVLDDTLEFVRGMLFYSFSDFKIEPRGNSDISATGSTPTAYSIYQIQGSTFASPVAGELVTTSGVVTGFFEGNTQDWSTFDGLFLQDATGDGDVATSDGILAIFDDLSGVMISIGDVLEVTGLVREYSEWDGQTCTENCVTAVMVVDDPVVSGTGSVTATVLDPPTDTDGQVEYLEAREGMLVSVDGNGTVVGPTSYGTIAVVDSDEGVGRVLRGSAQHGKVVSVRHYELFGEIGGGDPDNLIVGSTATGILGPLSTTYGDYAVITQQGAPWATVTSADPPADHPSWPPADSGRFTVVTLNAYNLDAGATTQLDKLVPIIVEAGCPTFVALQEVDTVSTVGGNGDEVLTEIVSRLASEGCPYSSDYSHPDVGDHGVAALWRTDAVSDASSTSGYQGCSPWGSTSAPEYDDHCDGIDDEYPLFSRRPLVLTATLNDTCPGSLPVEVKLVVAHLKSKNGGAPAARRRLEQAQFIAVLVDGFVAAGDERILVAGDLNDFEDSAPLAALTAGGELSSAWDSVAAADRYSYIYGGVSQVLDYVLYSSALTGQLVAAGGLHYNADFPHEPYSDNALVPWRASDHDLLAATFGACVDGLIFTDGFESGDLSAW